MPRINHPDWYPAYVNPDFDEIAELAKSGWDTCRILVNDDNNDFVIASGYGNTHTSLVDRYRIHLGRKRSPYVSSFILYHENGIALFNLEDVSGSQRARGDEWARMFEPYHIEILKDLIRESDLAL